MEKKTGDGTSPVGEKKRLKDRLYGKKTVSKNTHLKKTAFVPRRPDHLMPGGAASARQKRQYSKSNNKVNSPRTATPLSARDRYEPVPVQTLSLSAKVQGRTVPKKNDVITTEDRTEEIVEKVMPNPRRSLLQNADTYHTFTETITSRISAANVSVAKHSFLYLLPSPLNPYDLMVVPHDSIDKRNYYTLSSAGITQYREESPGVHSAEFTPLEQFEREHYIFALLSDLPFFKKYRMWKQFMEWKKSVRRRKIVACKQVLHSELLLLHPQLRASLLALKERSYMASCVQLYSTRAGTRTLDEFATRQAALNIKTGKWVKQFNAEARDIAYKACEHFLNTYLIDNGFRPVADLQVEGQNAREITFTERAAMRTQCRKLTKFIRLVDFVMVNAFLSLGLLSIQALVESLTAAQPPAAIGNTPAVLPTRDALYEISVHLEEKALHFDPRADVFKTRMETIIFDALRVITSRPRLLDHEVFHAYVQSSVEECGGFSPGHDLETMIVEHDLFQRMMEDIHFTMHTAFEDAQVQMLLFAPYVEKYTAHVIFLKEACPEKYASVSVEMLRDCLSEYITQEASFATLPDVIRVGILNLNCLSCNAVLKPSPTQCKTAFEDIVPRITQKKNEALLNELTSANDKLSIRPQCVDDFVFLCTYQDHVEGWLNEMEDQYSFLRELYSLIEDYAIEMSDVDKSNALSVGQTRSQLKSSLVAVEEVHEANVIRFRKELKDEIPHLASRVATALEQLGHSILHNPEADVNSVLEYLVDIGEERAEIQNLTDKFIRFQETLHIGDIVGSTPFSEVSNKYDVGETVTFIEKLEDLQITSLRKRMYGRAFISFRKKQNFGGIVH